MLQLRPILSTLRRHRTAALLIVFEIALTCAIVCNAVFLIASRIERLRFVDGMADDELVVLGTHSIGTNPNAEARTREDLAALRAIPGVRAAIVVGGMPYGQMQYKSGINLRPDQESPTVSSTMVNTPAGLPAALGLHLVAGRDFAPGEVMTDEQAQSSNYHLAGCLLSKALADRLFPAGNAVGQVIYVFGDAPLRILGVVERMPATRPDHGDASDLYSLILPVSQTFDQGQYILRTDPGERQRVLKAAVAALDKVDPHRVAQAHRTLEEIRAGFYAADVSMAWLLAGVCVALLVVTAFGIVGLASFWVQQRTRMIGTRRALGATRGQILRYFQAENLLLTTGGIALGMLLAYAVNQWLMTQYELPRLPFVYLPLGAVALWALGQLAVLAPARRAAALPPAHAMRGLA